MTMESKLLLQDNIPFLNMPPRRVRMQRQINVPSVVAVLATPKDNLDYNFQNPSKTVYNDNWLDNIAINHLSQSLQASTGLRSNRSGYEGLVEAATAASRNFSTTQQQEIVIEALQKAFPSPILSTIRILSPPSKFTREFFASFTTVFFTWLVGPCEVRESEFNGSKEKNAVYIKKCRFLEETNCVGMCTNLCKMPSQIFIKETLGVPVNMIPNFDDMSCEMIFGQNAPAASNDPALKQPCYKLCNFFEQSVKLSRS